MLGLAARACGDIGIDVRKAFEAFGVEARPCCSGG